jgi:hypothetical protein
VVVGRAVVVGRRVTVAGVVVGGDAVGSLGESRAATTTTPRKAPVQASRGATHRRRGRTGGGYPIGTGG